MAKLAIIGGGSLFVPSIVNGLGETMRRAQAVFEVELALYDVEPARAERMRAYAELVARAWAVPLTASVPATRAAALEGADVVLASVWLREEHARLDRLTAALGLELPEEGPGLAGWAAACAPWSLALAAEMRARCPDALFVTLMNPTDVIAGAVAEAGGLRAVGLCVEVDGLRGALAYYFDIPDERITLVHAGVNHDGWLLRLLVDGEDCTAPLLARWDEAERDPDFHPGNLGIRPILDLTGHLRSSAYHHWPYRPEPPPDREARWRRWAGKRERCEAALAEAVDRGQPIADPPHIHPERSRMQYPHTGQTLGRLMESLIAGAPHVLPLQVPNHGAIANFPAQAVVEVPTLVQGRAIRPLAVGELPDWLGGYTRLLAVQRRLVIEYLCQPRLETLKRALAVLPMFGTPEGLNRYAEALHHEFGPDLGAE
jgi:alpha-galactosidase/6-phospho-beta-glucosidase family protein